MKKDAAYKLDVRALANWYLDGKDELYEAKLVFWAEECYEITVEEMLVDVDAELAKMFPGDKFRLAALEKMRAKGRKSYYRYPYGRMPIDEAIEMQKERLARY